MAVGTDARIEEDETAHRRPTAKQRGAQCIRERCGIARVVDPRRREDVTDKHLTPAGPRDAVRAIDRTERAQSEAGERGITTATGIVEDRQTIETQRGTRWLEGQAIDGTATSLHMHLRTAHGGRCGGGRRGSRSRGSGSYGRSSRVGAQ
jgi:hypothetical protein